MQRKHSQLEKYRILGLVGRGQFGKVLCARHRDTGRLVALKELEPQRFPTSKLLRELRFLLSLQHPNIVRCESLIHHNSYRYLVMDYCEGGTLRDLMNSRVPLSMGQVVRLMLDVLRGLEHAHAQEIIHCDIKPENILLHVTEYGWLAKISDFGIAKVSQEIATDTTNTGSPGYMAPERFYGQFSVMSDLYAVGVMLYEFLVGKRPFSGMPMDLMNAHLNQRVTLPDTVPAALQDVVLKSLEKLPKRRFANATEMRLVLEEILANHSLESVYPVYDTKPLPTMNLAQKEPFFFWQQMPEFCLGLVGGMTTDQVPFLYGQTRHNLQVYDLQHRCIHDLIKVDEPITSLHTWQNHVFFSTARCIYRLVRQGGVYRGQLLYQAAEHGSKHQGGTTTQSNSARDSLGAQAWLGTQIVGNVVGNTTGNNTFAAVEKGIAGGTKPGTPGANTGANTATGQQQESQKPGSITEGLVAPKPVTGQCDDWILSPAGDWLAVISHQMLDLRYLSRSKVTRLEFANRDLFGIAVVDRHHLVVAASRQFEPTVVTVDPVAHSSVSSGSNYFTRNQNNGSLDQAVESLTSVTAGGNHQTTLDNYFANAATKTGSNRLNNQGIKADSCRLMVISRRGNLMHRLLLPAKLRAIMSTHTKGRVLGLEETHDNSLLLIDLCPYRLTRLLMQYPITTVLPTHWGYVVAGRYNPQQTILILMDLQGQDLSHVLVDGDVTALGGVGKSQLAVAVTQEQQNKLYLLELKKLKLDLMF
ncbi:MAG: serine/threonine-protein kinase [Pseudanabaenaceae cyanobacterium]|jgi:serine/threonine protein kinase